MGKFITNEKNVPKSISRYSKGINKLKNLQIFYIKA